MTSYDLQGVKPLTIDQYERAKQTALERVITRIGDKPTRQQFQRDFGRLWTALDVLALVIFVAALLVSSLHILTWTGREAKQIYDESGVAGWTVDEETFARVHQAGLIALSESSILLFTIMARLYRSRVRWVLLMLALGAAAFVFAANLASGIHGYVAILIPSFTVGISLRLEALVVEGLKHRNEVDEKYKAALVTWEQSSYDATQHPDYLPVLRREIWEKLVSLKANKEFADAPAAFKAGVVARELARELWAYESAAALPAHESGTDQAEVKRPFGSIPHEAGDGAAIGIMPTSNGHTASGSVKNVTK